MKKLRFFGLLALIMALSVAFVACGSDGGGESGSGVEILPIRQTGFLDDDDDYYEKTAFEIILSKGVYTEKATVQIGIDEVTHYVMYEIPGRDVLSRGRVSITRNVFEFIDDEMRTKSYGTWDGTITFTGVRKTTAKGGGRVSGSTSSGTGTPPPPPPAPPVTPP